MCLSVEIEDGNKVFFSEGSVGEKKKPKENEGIMNRDRNIDNRGAYTILLFSNLFYSEKNLTGVEAE